MRTGIYRVTHGGHVRAAATMETGRNKANGRASERASARQPSKPDERNNGSRGSVARSRAPRQGFTTAADARWPEKVKPMLTDSPRSNLMRVYERGRRVPGSPLASITTGSTIFSFFSPFRVQPRSPPRIRFQPAADERFPPPPSRPFLGKPSERMFMQTRIFISRVSGNWNSAVPRSAAGERLDQWQLVGREV